MRLRAEQLLGKLGYAKEYFVQNIVPQLTITTDTIVTSTPKRVEDIVNVGASASQHRESEDSSNELNAVANARKDTAHINSQSTEGVTVSDTMSHALPKKVKQDTTVRQVVKPDTIISTPKPTAIVVQEAGEIETNRKEPVSNTRLETSLPIDTASFVMAANVDSIAIDSLELVANVPVKTFSMEGHKAGVLHPMRLDRSDGVFALLVICFLLLAHVYNGGLAFFKENITLVFSATKSESLETQNTSRDTVFSFFLVFLAVLLISISVYEGLDRFYPLLEVDKRPFVTIGSFVLLILSFVVAKMMINRFIGYVFDFGKHVEAWNRAYLVLFSILGLLCFFPTLMLVYSSYWHSIIIGFVLVLFLIVQVILFLKVIVFFIGQKFNLLYLIAYLCTIEILPYIFLGIGLVHLYNTDIF